LRKAPDTRLSLPEAEGLLFTLSPLHYARSLGFSPYKWQEDVLKSAHRRKVVNGARQAGKSTIVSAKPCHIARFFPGSVSLVIAATEYQAFLDMQKIGAFIGLDRGYPGVERSSDRLIKLDNGSWIMVVPATEKAARGPSAPRLILLDEASRIEDVVYRSGVVPMLTDNPSCELVSISTPNGRDGFFFRSFRNPAWERYEVRSPWEVVDIDFRLREGEPEGAYRERLARQGVRGYYSPRHRDLGEQEFNLGEMGPLMYRQEYCAEFVEPEDQVFSYGDIERLRESAAGAVPLGGIGEAGALTI
jgi:hypothetical protein